MAIDLKSLRKLESVPASEQARERDEDERVLVLIKLRAGAAPPAYVAQRSRISQELFSSEISVADLRRLESDPSVESVALSRPLAYTR